MRALLVLVFVISSTTASVNKSAYFPEHAFGDRGDQFATDYYSTWLSFFNEPSLLKQTSTETGAESYRFLWLRTFHHAVVIRLDVAKDGTGTLFTKIAAGEAGFGMRNRKIAEDTSRPMSVGAVQLLLTSIHQKDFWTIPSYTTADQTGTDGSEWVFEGTSGGKYHVVARWTPCNSSRSDKKNICAIGRAFALDLAHMNIPKDEVY
jgi:hypothetical protein